MSTYPLVDSPYLVADDGSFRVAEAPTGPPGGEADDKKTEKKLRKRVKKLRDLQRVLYADDRYSVLLVFQAMDAAGKDGTIRSVLSGVNPAGFQVFSFKSPSKEELDHDYLWRNYQCLPERGRIGVFNRSYYEEVLVVRVHPEFLSGQKLPLVVEPAELWPQRYQSIRELERHLARNGTIILKFWLNVSQQEQRRRFVARIDSPEKNWKFSARDVAESRHWDRYMEAYQDLLGETSRPWAPWYAIPADDKPYMRACVANIITKTLGQLPLSYPTPSEDDRKEMKQLRKELV